MRIRAAVYVRVLCCAMPIGKEEKKSTFWVYIRVPNLAVRGGGGEMKRIPRNSNVQQEIVAARVSAGRSGTSRPTGFGFLLLSRSLLMVLLVV